MLLSEINVQMYCQPYYDNSLKIVSNCVLVNCPGAELSAIVCGAKIISFPHNVPNTLVIVPNFPMPRTICFCFFCLNVCCNCNNRKALFSVLQNVAILKIVGLLFLIFSIMPFNVRSVGV